MSGLIDRLRPLAVDADAPPDAAAILAAIRDRLPPEALRLAAQAGQDAAARRRLELLVRNLLVRAGFVARDGERVAAELVAEMAGLGPIDPYMHDPEVTEIMVNGPQSVYVERRGRLERVAARFSDAEHVLNTVQRLIAPTGRRLDLGQPFVDARLPDGSRLHAVIPPIAVEGPLVTIRRFREQQLNARDLLERGTWSPALCLLLLRCVRKRLNILISGGTSSGKTTLLNVLASYVPHRERIVTIEEAAELRIRHPHVVSLETRGANHEGRGEVTLRDLVRNALRMRPDRLIVGEVRGAEAFDMLQAWNTGHAGSLSTLHANSAHDALTRLETMTLLAPADLTAQLAARLVRAAVDIVVHMERRGGGRFVQEVCARDAEAERLVTIFRRRQAGDWSRGPLPPWLLERLGWQDRG